MAIPSSLSLSDYNIAVGGTQIDARGLFQVRKELPPSIAASVQGIVRYSILDSFDWNLNTRFIIAGFGAGKPVSIIFDEDLNLLEKCGKAKPFWSAGSWSQSVVGTGVDTEISPPRIRYTWTDQ